MTQQYAASGITVGTTATSSTILNNYIFTNNWQGFLPSGTVINPTIGPNTQFTLTPQAVAAMAAPALGFNKYVNASDLLEEFIAYLGTEGVRKGEIMALPVELFIKWLVIRACEADQEEPGVVLTLPAPKQQPRCLGCGRWMLATPVALHDDRCARWHFARPSAPSLAVVLTLPTRNPNMEEYQ